MSKPIIIERKDFIKDRDRRISNSVIASLLLVLGIMTFGNIYALDKIYKKFTNSSFFVLKGVSIYGNSIISSSDILKSAGLNIGTDDIASLTPNIIQNRIKSQLRYVKNVEVKSDLFNGQLVIKVDEREPIAIVPISKSALIFGVIDINGFLTEIITNDNLSLPLYKNLIFIKTEKNIDRQDIDSITDSDINSCINSKSVKLSLNVIYETRLVIPYIYDEISSIDACNPNDIIIHLKNGLKIRISEDRIKEGLTDLSNWARHPKIQNTKAVFNYIDVRFSGSIYCG
ncbi:MAG: cell division protein FtsQ/DivIB [Candidatus Poribacteria bacterium]